MYIIRSLLFIVNDQINQFKAQKEPPFRDTLRGEMLRNGQEPESLSQQPGVTQALSVEPNLRQSLLRQIQFGMIVLT